MNNLFNLGTFFKFLGRNKLYTTINIFGLSVSLMFVILIAVYTTQELSTDKYHKKADRIYALANNNNLGSAYRLAYRIQERYPEVEKVCPTTNWNFGTTMYINDTKMKASLFFADSTFFDFFDFKLYHTYSQQALAARNYAIISKTFARKAFGKEDPLGQIIVLHDSVSVTVNGVMDDIKNSTIPYCDILVRIDNIKYFNSSLDSEAFNNAGSAYIFMMEKEGANLQAKAEDMAAYFKEFFWLYKNGIYDKVNLVPLKEIYFSELRGQRLQQGDWKLVMILLSVGIAILIFAVINYINLTAAQAGFRAKEMATRRLLGSARRELFGRLLLESTLLCFISFLLAMLLAALCAPYADDLLQTKIDLTGAVSPAGILIALSVILALGSISGWIPATMISNSNPLEIAKGSFRRKSKMIFSRVFIVFQNVITIMLLVASITMTKQTLHLINAPLGYNTDNIINVSTMNFKSKKDVKRFVEEVQQLASVKSAALAQGTPLSRGNNWTMQYNGNNISFQILVGDTAYVNMLGLQILREHNLAVRNNDCFYFSTQALKETGLEEDATEIRFDESSAWSIAGIIKDIHLGNIMLDRSPLLFRFDDFEQHWPWNILIEIQGNLAVAYEQVGQIYKQIAEMDFEGEFMDAQIEKSFDAQQRTSLIVLIFTAIAILISLLGLIAMSNYFIRQHTKEIAIRKVHGADNFRMLSKLILTFLSYVGIAFVIAVPFIWYIMQRWLSDYAYRIKLSPVIFIVAGGFCLLVSFVSVYWQSRVAAHANPVKTLKSE